jgi:UDP-N-acetylglucosamine 2-epimerase (non-hydrolysing)
MKRILTVFGTRPEAIKLAPVILELNKLAPDFESIVCVTAQHRMMLDQILNWFKIQPRFDLDLMAPNQGLSEFSSRVLTAVSRVIELVRPDVVIVQGDTTTVAMTALAAFYQKVPVAHVEAGLRTQNPYNPFPEEINRRVTSVLSSIHFAPTQRAADALSAEKVKGHCIFVTGNTVVDALQMTLKRKVVLDLGFRMDGLRIILVTAHRRESFGAPFESLCLALKDLVERKPDIIIVYPVHLNPNVHRTVHKILAGQPRIHLIDPLRYEQFCHLMARAYLILTDSGGVQEEAPILGKPTLVMRETTERPEAVEFGTARLVGTDRCRIVEAAIHLMSNEEAYRKMARAGSPFGDGQAAKRIVSILRSTLLPTPIQPIKKPIKIGAVAS